MGLCTTPTPRTSAGWTASGACTSGSTARPRAVTRRGSGGAAMTSTTASDGGELLIGIACRTLRHERRLVQLIPTREIPMRSEVHTSELLSPDNLVCRIMIDIQ